MYIVVLWRFSSSSPSLELLSSRACRHALFFITFTFSRVLADSRVPWPDDSGLRCSAFHPLRLDISSIATPLLRSLAMAGDCEEDTWWLAKIVRPCEGVLYLDNAFNFLNKAHLTTAGLAIGDWRDGYSFEDRICLGKERSVHRAYSSVDSSADRGLGAHLGLLCLRLCYEFLR